MSTRTVALATGKEFFISIGDIIVGCATSIEYSGQVEILTANCTSGKKKVPSGDDADYTLTVNGFVHIYPSGEVATNVSATQIETLMQNKTLEEWAYSGIHEGDPVRSGEGYITAFSQSTDNTALAGYNFTITPYEMPTLGVVPGE